MPELAIGFVGDRPVCFEARNADAAQALAGVQDAVIEAPDTWFWTLKVVPGGHRVCRGRERSYGFTFLSPEGYSANRTQVLAAYQAAGGDPARFDRFAAEFFADVQRRTAENDRRRRAAGLPV